MNLNEYQKKSARTLPQKGNHFHKLSNYALGVAGEAGEVADEIKKIVYHGHNLNIDYLRVELGDVLHYVAGLATMLDTNLEDIAKQNISKLEARYPKGFSEEDSRNRTV